LRHAGLQVAKSIDGRAELAVWFHLVAVDCSGAKAALVEAALARRAALQGALQADWVTQNQQLVDRWVGWAAPSRTRHA
jgi:hypothetical protein